MYVILHITDNLEKLKISYYESFLTNIEAIDKEIQRLSETKSSLELLERYSHVESSRTRLYVVKTRLILDEIITDLDCIILDSKSVFDDFYDEAYWLATVIEILHKIPDFSKNPQNKILTEKTTENTLFTDHLFDNAFLFEV